jgi:general secretion pathway protein I
MKTARRGERGFSLIELLVAFSIMAISLGILYNATGSSARSVGDVEQYQHAAVLAESLLTSRDTVPPTGWNETGQAGSFSWSIRSVPFETAVSRSDPTAVALHDVLLVVSWKAGERERRLELATLLPQGAIPGTSGARR